VGGAKQRISEACVADDGQRASVDEEDGPGVGEDLSVPMWVWTLLGFAAVTAVVIVAIILGGRGGEASPPARDATSDAQPAETQPPVIAPEPPPTQPG
jgi:hypothetical protein